jgi:hypothetical protein
MHHRSREPSTTRSWRGNQSDQGLRCVENVGRAIFTKFKVAKDLKQENRHRCQQMRMKAASRATPRSHLAARWKALLIVGASTDCRPSENGRYPNILRLCLPREIAKAHRL